MTPTPPGSGEVFEAESFYSPCSPETQRKAAQTHQSRCARGAWGHALAQLRRALDDENGTTVALAPQGCTLAAAAVAPLRPRGVRSRARRWPASCARAQPETRQRGAPRPPQLGPRAAPKILRAHCTPVPGAVMPLRLQQRVYFHQGASPVRKSVSVLRVEKRGQREARDAREAAARVAAAAAGQRCRQRPTD